MTTDGSLLEVTLAVERWAKSWFQTSSGDDVLSLDGLPCGWALHIEIADAVLDAVLPALGQRTRLVGRPMFRGLKRRGVDRAIRAWSLRTLAVTSLRRGGLARSDVAFISELATPSTTDGLIAVAARLPDPPAIGVADPRALRRWRAAGLDPSPIVVSPAEEFRQIRSVRGSVEDRWRAACRHPPLLEIGGIDLTPIAIEAAEPIVRRSLPWVIVEAAGIRSFLEAAQAHTVVLATDQHRIGRLTTHVAAERGTRSVVLQHGLPQATLGYLPLSADRLAAWSEASAQWFVERGTPVARVTVVGNPRLDWLAGRDRAEDRARVDQTLASAGAPRVLLALSVASVRSNRRLVEVALQALALMPMAALVIKLHPGGSDWREVLLESTWGDDVRRRTKVVDRPAIERFLGWADVVVVHRSTVAGEALAAGCPVIVVETGERSIATAELATLHLATASDGPGLSTVAVSLADPKAAREYVESRHEALERIMGPTDGRSAERAANLVTSHMDP